MRTFGGSSRTPGGVPRAFGGLSGHAAEQRAPARGAERETPTEASARGHHEVVRLLMEAGPDGAKGCSVM